MELEHYPGMTETSIEAMIDEAHQRFDFYQAHVIHRVGVLQPADQIVMVAVTSAHRGESFKACEFLMDYLKTQAPFGKKRRPLQGLSGLTPGCLTTRPWRVGAFRCKTLSIQIELKLARAISDCMLVDQMVQTQQSLSAARHQVAATAPSLRRPQLNAINRATRLLEGSIHRKTHWH